MLQIGKDWRALIGNACWSWILAFIPMIFKAISIATTDYRFDGTYMLTQETGLITKKTTNVDLQLIQEIVGHSSEAMTMHYRTAGLEERKQAMLKIDSALGIE